MWWFWSSAWNKNKSWADAIIGKISLYTTKIDVWPKILTPSNELRKWYHQDVVAHWDEFKVRYLKELEAYPTELNDLRQLAVQEQITLLTAAKEEQHNHVVILKQCLEQK